jgi:hypothetical protein
MKIYSAVPRIFTYGQANMAKLGSFLCENINERWLVTGT